MKELTKKEFAEVMAEEGKNVLIEYWAPWCVYCRRIAPALEALAEEQGDKLFVGKINIDEEPELSKREKIETIPTLVLYVGGKRKGSLTGPDSKMAIETFLEENLSV